jgi:hypothetical protein
MPPIKGHLTKDEWGKLGDESKGYYVADGERYRLDVQADTGWAFEDVTALRRAHDADRHARKSAEGTLSSWTELGVEPKAAREALDKLKAMANWTPDDKVREQMEAVKAALSKEYNEREATLKGQLDSVTGQLESVLVDSALATAIGARGNHKMLVPAMKPHMKVMLDEASKRFVARVLGEKGTPRISIKDPSGYMGPEELVEEFARDKDWAPAFNGSGAAGAGSPASGGPGGRPGGMNLTLKRSEMHDQGRLNAVLAEAQKAGVKPSDIQVVDG